METDTQVEEMTDAEITEAAEAETQETVEEHPETPEVTIEDVQKELQDTKAELEKRLKQNRDKELFIQRQGNELGELRKIKDALIKRREELDSIDPTEQMVNDPQGFRNTPYEKANIDRDLRNVEDQERQLQFRAQRDQAEQVLLGTSDDPGPAHDIYDNIGTIKEILKDGGDPPEAIERFTQDPFSFPPGIVRSLNAQARLARENAELREEIGKLKEKPSSVLKNIERTARTPLKNQAGAPKTTDYADLTDEEIAGMSNEDIDKLLNQYGR